MCLNEDDIQYVPRENLTKRQRNLCNDELAINRDIVSCFLAVHLEKSSKPVKCLEAVGVCGIYGMLWEKYFGENVDVTINGFLEDDVNLINKNIKMNDLKGTVINEDPCILLRKNLYDFVFLNCKTNTTKYLDSLFSNIKEDAVFVITTSEDPALYWQTAEIALRCYGGVIAKTSFHREVAVRLVIAEMVRVAAKYNKSISVLCSVVYKPQQSFTIIAKVKKGGIHTNVSISNIEKLAYCSLCENKKFIPNSYFLDKLSSVDIGCECSKNSEGKVIIGIGPLWAGNIFDVDFVESTLKCSKGLSCSSRVCVLLDQILEEARCGEDIQSNPPPSKKSKSNNQTQPYFYINTHRHSAKEFKLLKLKKVINLLRKNGYCASRTHFDSEAVRTNASISECIDIIRKNS